MHRMKAVLSSETCIQANMVNGCLSTSFSTLLIYLQCSDNDFGGGDVSRNVSYMLTYGILVNLLNVFFSTYLPSMLSTTNSILEATNV